MKLYKALKLRKSLIGDIAKLKQQIKEKNSYLDGSVNPDKYSVEKIYQNLLKKIEELTGLKFAIFAANAEIQSRIFMLSEYKALIAFWNEVSVAEGNQVIGYGESAIKTYMVQFDEEKRNNIVNDFQKKVDIIQEEIDNYNYNTDIPWDLVPLDSPTAE